MKAPVQVQEKILRVWSSRKKDDYPVRLRYTIADRNGCRIYTIKWREEWDCSVVSMQTARRNLVP